jgi:thiamine pyrophosphokinase
VKKIIIIADGTVNNADFHKTVLYQADLVICADGGAHHAKALDVIPDYVIGDMDSIAPDFLDELRNNGHTQVVIDPNQDTTDLEAAITLAISFKPREIILLGAIGDCIDHTLANALCLMKIAPMIKTRLIDDKNEVTLVQNFVEITGKKDDIVSVIPLTDVKGLTYEGLKWKVCDQNVSLGWFGIRNRMLGEKASVRLRSGKVIVVKQGI